MSCETSAAPAAASPRIAIGPSQLAAERTLPREHQLSQKWVSGSINIHYAQGMMKNVGISPQCPMTSVTADAATAAALK